MRISRQERSNAVRRPPWYVRRMVDRPEEIAPRGPWRVKHPKVEDAVRVDAAQLYPQARPVAGRTKPIVQRGEVVGFDRQHFVRGTRVARVAGVDLLLSPRQRVPGKSARKITAMCPTCGGQFHLLYLTPAGPGPRCRRCAGLIYESQARSRSARLGRRCLVAEKQKSWDGIKPVNAEWAYRFFKRRTLAEEHRMIHLALEQAREAKARARTERRERREKDREERRMIRETWKAYIDGLDSSRLKRAAYKYRLLLRRLAADGPPGGILLQELGRLESVLIDFPEDVRRFELRSPVGPSGIR